MTCGFYFCKLYYGKVMMCKYKLGENNCEYKRQEYRNRKTIGVRTNCGGNGKGDYKKGNRVSKSTGRYD